MMNCTLDYCGLCAPFFGARGALKPYNLYAANLDGVLTSSIYFLINIKVFLRDS